MVRRTLSAIRMWLEELTVDRAGGLYSTSNDVNRLVKAILSETALSSSAEVRGWLKPLAETSSLYRLVGFPWEITRADNLTPAHPHLIDIYGKDGGIYGYWSRMAVIPEYGVGITLLTAGDYAALDRIFEATLSTLIPAVEEQTRAEARRYAGTFSTPTTSNVRSNMSFAIDNGPGLNVTQLISNGSDVLEGLAFLWGAVISSAGQSPVSFRAYPTGLDEEASGGITREDWRMVGEAQTVVTSELPSSGAYDNACLMWQSHDTYYYGGVPVDRLVFLKKDEQVVAVEIPALRITLNKNI